METSPARKQLLILIVLFFGPLLAAWLLYQYGSEFLKSKTTNHGFLITPVVSMQDLKVQSESQEKSFSSLYSRKWLLLFVEPQQCHAECEANLLLMRQVRLALGENMMHVARAVLSFSQPDDMLNTLLSNQYTGTDLIQSSLPEFSEKLKQYAWAGDVEKNGGLFIVDPQFNAMMYYAKAPEAKALYEDLKQLIKASA